jgi:hypothetical protein
VWSADEPALSAYGATGAREQIDGQIANPPDPIVNAQRDGVVRNASRTRTSYRTRCSGETAARWFYRDADDLGP